MLTTICLLCIGFQLNAPTWYYVLVAIGFFFRIISVVQEAYKKGKEDG